MLDVHILESVLVLFSDQLVEQRLLKVDSFQVQQDYHAIEVALVAHAMVGIAAIVVNIDLLMDHVLGSAHLGQQVQSNVLESEQAKTHMSGNPLATYQEISSGHRPISSLSINSCSRSF